MGWHLLLPFVENRPAEMLRDLAVPATLNKDLKRRDTDHTYHVVYAVSSYYCKSPMQFERSTCPVSKHKET